MAALTLVTSLRGFLCHTGVKTSPSEFRGNAVRSVPRTSALGSGTQLACAPARAASVLPEIPTRSLVEDTRPGGRSRPV